MNYPQLMKILRSISTDLCMIEFIAHMKVDENGDSCLSGAEDPNMVFGRYMIAGEDFQDLLEATEWKKWADYQGPGLYSFEALVHVDSYDTELCMNVKHAEVSCLMNEAEERKFMDDIKN